MATIRNTAALLAAALVALGSFVGEAKGGTIINDPFRYFQHQEGTNPTDDPFMGVCYSAAGYNAMLGIVSKGNGTWKAATGGTEAYAKSISSDYNGVSSHDEYRDMDLINDHSSWLTANENFVATYLTAPKGFGYRTVDYALKDFGKLDLKNAIGALALVDRVDIKNADLAAAEWWMNFHVVSLYDLDIGMRTVKFTDSNIDRVGTEYTDKAGGNQRQDFRYGILTGGGQTMSWTAAGIVTNADGTNMDDELLESIRVIYLVAVPEPSSFALAGLGVFALVMVSYHKRQAAV